MTQIHIPVAVGEVLDKLSILQIKSERLTDEAKLANVRQELSELSAAWRSTGLADNETDRLFEQLKAVNETLWQIEDDIREAERRGEFGDEFVALARSVYRENDQRAAIKRAINEHTGSTLIEEKSYAAY